MTLEGIKSLVDLLFACGPGAWIAFTFLSAETRFSSRLGLSIALSPFMTGFAVAALTVLGFEFKTAAIIIALASIPGVALIWLKRPQNPAFASWGAPAACFIVLAAALAILWIHSPEARIYAWHNMWQTEAVYQTSLLPRAPEEMGLAGEHLRYPWFGHTQVAAIGEITDVSPLKIFPVLNVMALLALILLLTDSVQEFVAGKPAASAFFATAGLLMPNLLGMFLSEHHLATWWVDQRTTTPLHKFMHFDLMTSGLALLAATLAFTLASLRDGASRAWATTILCLCAVVLTYPLLFPPAFMIAVASVAARPVEAWRRGEGLRLDRATLGRALTLIAPLIVFFGYYKLISSGDGGAVFADLTSIRHAIRDAVISTALFLPLLGLAAWRLSRAPDPARLALFAAGIALAGLFVFVDLPAGNEYKFLVAAMIIAIPLCAEQAALLLDQIHPAAARFAPAAAASVIFLASAPTLAQRHIPWDDDHKGVALTEGGFHLAPPSAPEFAWMRAIRDQTPSDTVILHPDLSTPVTVMTERSSYLAPVSRPERTGYSTQDRNLLANIRGYGPAVVDHRALVRGEIYQGASETEFAAISMELAELHRPIAVFAPASNSYVHWLANQHRGHAIWNGNSDTVWLVTPQELVTAHL